MIHAVHWQAYLNESSVMKRILCASISTPNESAIIHHQRRQGAHTIFKNVQVPVDRDWAELCPPHPYIYSAQSNLRFVTTLIGMPPVYRSITICDEYLSSQWSWQTIETIRNRFRLLFKFYECIWIREKMGMRREEGWYQRRDKRMRRKEIVLGAAASYNISQKISQRARNL